MPQTLGGQYHLVERVGRGGMAEAWRAISRGPAGFEKIVVIKRVLPHLARSSHFMDMLVREAKIAARLSHANIVQIFDLGVDEDTYFIAMEHVDGLNLSQMLVKVGQRRMAVSLPLRLHIVAEVAKALDFAHRQRDDSDRELGIVHRDVSPSNVLLSREGEVKLADFGIATARTADMLDREKGRIRGKVSYMSPEQARAEEVDRRSDIFSLGIVLFELATGRRLFRAEDTRATLKRVRQVKVPKILDVEPELPADLAPIVGKALAKDPEDRFQSAGEMQSALSALIFSLGQKVDQGELGKLVTELMPTPRGKDPNKLAVDLLIRALDDATGVVSQELTRHPLDVAEAPLKRERATAAEVPQKRAPEQEVRKVTLLVVRVAREGDRAVAEKTIKEAAGFLVPSGKPEVTAIFGYPKAVENSPVRAVRAALEVRRRLSDLLGGDDMLLPSSAIIRATVSLDRSVTAAPPVQEFMATPMGLLDRSAPGEVLVPMDLVPLLESGFQLRGGSSEDVWTVAGPRRRTERLAIAAAGGGSIIGRDSELQRVLRLLSAVCDGRGAVLEIHGEPGSGKTRLLYELRNLVTPRDIAFRLGRCDPQAAGAPYELVTDLVRDICGVDDADGPDQLHAKVRRLRHLGLAPRETRILGGLFGLHYPVDVARDLGSRPRVLWLVEATRKMLTALGRDQPMVIALEDLQWLDESSGDVVRLLARAIHGMRVLLLLTRRPGADLSLGDDVTERMVLRPLDEPFVRELAAQSLGAELLDDRLAHWIASRTGGNPGFVVELCRALRETESIRIRRRRATAARPLDELHVPGSVLELVTATVDGLRKGERRVLRASSVIGSLLEPDMVRHVSQVKAGEVTRRLEALDARGLLLATDPSKDPACRRYVFRHDLVRQAVTEGIGPQELRELHGRAAEYLERRGAPEGGEKVEVLAEHLRAAGDELRAVDLLFRAGEATMERGEPGSAACLFARAANVVGELADAASRQRGAELGLKAAEALLEAGQREAARGWFVQARELAELGDAPLFLARALTGEAELDLVAGEPETAQALLRRALGAAEALGERELAARAAVNLGRALMQLGEAGEAATHLEKAAAAAEVLGDEPLMCRALVVLASARVMEEKYREAEELLDRVTERALRSRVAEERAEALMGLGELALAQDMLDEAHERFTAAREVALQNDLLVREAQSTLAAAQVQVLRGKPGQAHALAADVSHSAQALGLAPEAAFARVLLGYLDATELGDADGARKLASALKELERAGRRSEAAMGNVLLGWAFRHHGKVPAARRALSAAVELAGEAFAPAARRLATVALGEIEADESD